MRVLAKILDMISTGCTCHALHNATSKAAEVFLKISGLIVEDGKLMSYIGLIHH